MSSSERHREKGRGEVAEPAEALELPPGGERESERTGEGVKKQVKEEREPGEPAEKVKAPPKVEGLWKGEPDAMGILRNILEKHPDIGEAVKEEILDWARLQEYLPPQTVAYLLGQMKGISSQTANIVAQKYSLALQKAQLEGRPGVQMQILPQPQPPQAPFQVPAQGYLPPQHPFQLPQQAPWQVQPFQPQVQPTQVQPLPIVAPQVPRPEKTYKLVVDGQEIETDEKGFMAWKRYLGEQKKISEKPPSALTKAEIEDIMLKTKTDLAGAFSETLKQDRAKRGAAEEKETLTQVIKNLPTLISEAMAKTKSAEELPTQIAEAVARAMPRPPPQPSAPPVTKEEIAAMTGRAASEAAARVVEAKAEEEAEQRRHSELLSAIRSGMVAQQTSGYKEDSYRFLGQGLSAMASAVERKEPIKIVLEHAPEILGSQPLPKEIAPGAAGEEMARVIGQLKPEWVREE